MKEEPTRIATIATAMLNAGLVAAADRGVSVRADLEALKQAALLLLGTMLESATEIATRPQMHEAVGQTEQETPYRRTALCELTDWEETLLWPPSRFNRADPDGAGRVGMDDATYQRCLQHLAAAEACMVESIDGWHLAHLSHVVESLKEDYGFRVWPIMGTARAGQSS